MCLRAARPILKWLGSHRWLAAALVVAAWPPVAWLGARALIVRVELPRADALVVLSGSANYIERTRWAAGLYHTGRAPLVVLTNDDQRAGWSSAEQRNPLFVELEAAELSRAGVPAESIVVLPEPAVSGTYDEITMVRDRAREQGLGSLIFVTSPYHTRRARWTLARVYQGSGILVGLEHPPAGFQSPTPATWWWRLHGWRAVAGEYVKNAYYRLHYG